LLFQENFEIRKTISLALHSIFYFNDPEDPAIFWF
jgi:hypothetical protein